jgi:hypothetical protein
MALIKVVSYECEAAGRLPDGRRVPAWALTARRTEVWPAARLAALMTQFIKRHTFTSRRGVAC